MRQPAWIALLIVVAVPGGAYAQAAATTGELISPFPTLHNLSIEWPLTGDDNANATATVRYRKQGDGAFGTALPLFRVPAGSNVGFDWQNKMSGSIFGLEAGSAYEIEVTLSDPDGGDTTATVMATTRTDPVIPADANEVMVDPATIAQALDASAPGDVLVLGDGSYSEIAVPNDGTVERPIALRAQNPGGAVVEGDVRIDGRSFVIVEGLTVHGQFKFNDAESITVRGCTIQTPDDGIVSYGSGVNNAVITDNVISGPTVWMPTSLGVDGDNLGEGVVLTGAGNVIAFNRVTGFRDCLSLLEDTEAANQISNDFYGNDLSVCADDAIEADFAMGNVRVYQNRIADSFMGISSQPSLGGPTYFVRNVMYNVLFQAFKLQRSSVGDVGLHNTVVKSGDAFSVNTEDVFSRAWFRNNLFIGGPGGSYGGYDSGPGDVMQLPSADPSCSFDYDGYGSIGSGAFAGLVGDVSFDSLAALHGSTSEAHAVELDLTAFAENVAYPADPFLVASSPSLVLAANGAAVDQGLALANVNDGFAGANPDLGAYELGAQVPNYGPGGTVVDPGSGGATTGTGGAVATAGSGGASGGSAGVANSGGASGTTSATSGGASSSGGGSDAGEDSGCGCRTGRTASPGALGVLLAGCALWFGRRRRRTAMRTCHKSHLP